MNMEKKRIEYIDMAKGICMTIIVLGHSNYSINIKGITIAIVPLFFAISGFFFNEKREWKVFLLKKLNTLIIPFIFFYLTAYFIFYILKYFQPNLLVTTANGILDVLNNRQFFNGPIWFLLDIFWCNIFFYLITNAIKNDIFRIVIVSIIGFVGWYLGQKDYLFPLYFDVSMTSLPFFAMGYYLKKSKILDFSPFKLFPIIAAIVLYFISYMIENNLHQRLSLHYNAVEGWSTYLLSFTTVLSLLFLCKAIQWVPFINYIGKNSLIVLCVHHMIYRPLMVLLKPLNLNDGGFTVAFLTLIISMFLIFPFNKFLPWFVAQKECFNTNKNTNEKKN